jgi:hypothetical protein
LEHQQPKNDNIYKLVDEKSCDVIISSITPSLPPNKWRPPFFRMMVKLFSLFHVRYQEQCIPIFVSMNMYILHQLSDSQKISSDNMRECLLLLVEMMDIGMECEYFYETYFPHFKITPQDNYHDSISEYIRASLSRWDTKLSKFEENQPRNIVIKINLRTTI